jgi:hypothetical protein
MPRMFDYQRKLVEEAVALNAGTDAGKRGAWWLNRIKVTDGGEGSLVGSMRYNFNFRYDLLDHGTDELAPTALSYSANGAGALFARSDWSESASWLSMVAGIYDQSHAHQDQGSFSFFRNGWLAVTSNILSHSGIHQDVGAQNVLRFEANGAVIGQNMSVNSKTVSDSADVLQVDADLTRAYSNNAALVSHWTRSLRYQRSIHALQVHDKCIVAPGVLPVWQVHVPVQPSVAPDGSIVAGGLTIRPILPSAPQISIVDMPSTDSDYNGGYRIELRAESGCEFTVELRAQ